MFKQTHNPIARNWSWVWEDLCKTGSLNHGTFGHERLKNRCHWCHCLEWAVSHGVPCSGCGRKAASARQYPGGQRFCLHKVCYYMPLDFYSCCHPFLCYQSYEYILSASLLVRVVDYVIYHCWFWCFWQLYACLHPTKRTWQPGGLKSCLCVDCCCCWWWWWWRYSATFLERVSGARRGFPDAWVIIPKSAADSSCSWSNCHVGQCWEVYPMFGWSQIIWLSILPAIFPTRSWYANKIK